MEGLDEGCASHSSRYHLGRVDAAAAAAVDLIKCRRFIWDVNGFMLESVDENLGTYNCNFPLPDGVALVTDCDVVAKGGGFVLKSDSAMARRIRLVWFPESDKVYL